MSTKTIGRRVITNLTFSRVNVDRTLKDYLSNVNYVDEAAGNSDSLTITLQNINSSWLKEWYPQKGNTMGGTLKFKNWNNKGKDKKLRCGTFTLDDIKFSFGPKTAVFSGVSAPADESFKTLERDTTWEAITIKGIAGQIADRYGLTLAYFGPEIMIAALEQSDNDSSFLNKLCDDYGLCMKIYRNKIIIYDQCQMEAKRSVAKLQLKSFEGSLNVTDSILGVYNGAKVSYKTTDGKQEISIYVGLVAEGSQGSRTLKVNETCKSEAEARLKGAAAVNKSNKNATVISGSIFPNPKICAGVNVSLGADFGKLKGKYAVDKVSWSVTGSGGVKQNIEAHKVIRKVKA